VSPTGNSHDPRYMGWRTLANTPSVTTPGFRPGSPKMALCAGRARAADPAAATTHRGIRTQRGSTAAPSKE